MAVKGVSPSYFAGMPTVARDPRAGQVDPSFAAMPGQALSEANAMGQRRHEFDSGEAFKAKELALQTEQQQGAASREDKRLAMYQQGEDRRQAQQGFENDRLKAADTRKLVEALQSAEDDGEFGIAEAIAEELRSRGVGVKPIARQPAGPAGAPAGAPAPAPQPMSAADAQTSKQLDQAEASIIPKLRGNMPAKQVADADLSAQLDGIESKYMGALSKPSATPMPYEAAMAAAKQSGALGVMQVPGGWAPDDGGSSTYQAKPRSLVPGRSLRPNVAQSNAFISDGDPYSKIK
jgi:hypothetical protein